MLSLFSWIEQVGAVTWLNLRNLRERVATSAATVVGVAGVVMVFVGVLSMAVGFQRTLASSGKEDAAVVIRGGASSEMSSGLGLEETRVIADAPGVANDGRPVVSAELLVMVDVPLRTTSTRVNMPLRGVEAGALHLHGVEIVEGRAFEPGRREIIVGSAAATEYEGLEVGTTQRWGENDWTVVGRFSAGGSVADSEAWCDAKVLQPAYRRGNSFSSVHVQLESEEAFEAFKDALTTDPRLTVDVFRQSDYYAEQSEILSTVIRVLGYLIAGLMAVGAVFGALNTMYTAVSSRTREIGTLRALGFGVGPVMISVLVESLVLSLLGGVLGATVAYLMFNGARAATLNWQTFSQVAFDFAVTPGLLLQAAIFALVMGLVGGFFPAFRAARLPVATALRRT